MSTSQWLQLELHCNAQMSESLGALLIEAGALGVEERPLDRSTPPAWSLATHEELAVIAYFDAEFPSSQQAQVADIAASFGAHSMIWSQMRDDGWATRWQSFFHPLPIGRSLLICPTWETPPDDPHRAVIWLDPGMAFGTGHHPTTLGCMVFLEQLLSEGPAPLLDVGCGSGILSFAALKLGAPHATGIDIDADAIQIAKENAELNGLSSRCHFSTAGLDQLPQVFSLVVANLQSHILIPMAPDLCKQLTPGGHLLLSGIWSEFRDETLEAYAALSCQLLEERIEEGWCTLLLQGPQG